MDTIIITAIQVSGRHGVPEWEREHEQPFEVDLEIDLDLNEACHSDDLCHTIDYADIIADIVLIVSSESFKLVERLAEEIAQTVLDHGDVHRVVATVRKMEPPVPHDVGHVGVRVVRSN